MEENYNQIFVQKTKALAVRLINELSEIPYSDKVSVIRKQIFRSSTSVASNYRAMCRAWSKKERYAKICIVVEEADETLFWLEIIEEIKMLPKEILADLTAKCLDVLKATSSYKKKLNLGSWSIINNQLSIIRKNVILSIRILNRARNSHSRYEFAEVYFLQSRVVYFNVPGDSYDLRKKNHQLLRRKQMGNW